MISLEVSINFAVPGDGKNHGSSKTWKIPTKFFVSSYEMHFQGRQHLQCSACMRTIHSRRTYEINQVPYGCGTCERPTDFLFASAFPAAVLR